MIFSSKGEGYAITREDIEAHAALLHTAKFAILNTGWADKYGTWDFFKHPYLTEGAAKALIEMGIQLIATDGSSVDSAYGFSGAEGPPNRSFHEVLEGIDHESIRNEAHLVLLSHDCLIVEYLCNLDKIHSPLSEFLFLPLKITHADGSPVRAVCVL